MGVRIRGGGKIPPPRMNDKPVWLVRTKIATRLFYGYLPPPVKKWKPTRAYVLCVTTTADTCQIYFVFNLYTNTLFIYFIFNTFIYLYLKYEISHSMLTLVKRISILYLYSNTQLHFYEHTNLWCS